MKVQHNTALLLGRVWVWVWVLMSCRVQQPGGHVWRLVKRPRGQVWRMVTLSLFWPWPRPSWWLLAVGRVALGGSRVTVVFILVA